MRLADNGPGIPPADREQALHAVLLDQGRGSGLGLAIVRRIIVEHGGSIEVADNTRKGTRSIELPIEL